MKRWSNVCAVSDLGCHHVPRSPWANWLPASRYFPCRHHSSHSFLDVDLRGMPCRPSTSSHSLSLSVPNSAFRSPPTNFRLDPGACSITSRSSRLHASLLPLLAADVGAYTPPTYKTPFPPGTGKLQGTSPGLFPLRALESTDWVNTLTKLDH